MKRSAKTAELNSPQRAEIRSIVVQDVSIFIGLKGRRFERSKKKE